MENKQSGLANPWIQLALSVAFVTAYEVLLKFGAIETANIANSGWSWTGLSGLASLYVWFAIPLVVNGRVFVATEGTLTIYGLIP